MLDLFSKRQRVSRGEVTDVYTYDQIPQPLRVQIVHIWRDVLGDENDYSMRQFGTQEAYTAIVTVLRREYGFFVLQGGHTFSAHGLHG